jgi:hypothetical protein
MDEREIEDLTYHHFPRPVVRDLTRSVFVGRKRAWDHCSEAFAAPEADNVRPFYGRGVIEGLMRGVAERHGQIVPEVLRQQGQPWNHTELISGPVVMTAASVQRPLDLVDPADYRRSLAGNPQTQFEPFEEAAPENGRLYVILLHSRSYWTTIEERRDFGFLPGSVYLAYPTAELESYRHWVNLFDEFPAVVKDHTPQEWDEVTLARYVERSRKTA